MSTRTEAAIGDLASAGLLDEFGPYLKQALQDTVFRLAYEAADRRYRSSLPLAIDGREYHRRQRGRRGRK